MLPLDLTAAPPRSPWDSLDGLYLMPRTIDKLRAQLPGGKPGAYITAFGVTAVLLKLIKVSEDELRECVALAGSDDDVAAWLRDRGAKPRYDKANAILSNLTVAEVTPDLLETFERFYAGRPPELQNLFEILLWDDRRCFAGAAPGL